MEHAQSGIPRVALVACATLRLPLAIRTPNREREGVNGQGLWTVREGVDVDVWVW
eukprot:CAMPEP_0174723952 /NCGR_PEP_ID=MMETSP1094-20130205/42317_1 /TAXON_ID=156173 /ORGANISM="Chrysochromulina brevifilum, Strain UTEX LB 985" /LENGTH=54 /DNA_ID=CAMNT_0015925087 /DNA_START=253 /DNA_END=414 /DNA_ORIENTATION=+